MSGISGGEVGLGRRRRDTYLLHFLMFPRLSTGTQCQASVAGKWVSVEVEGTRIYCHGGQYKTIPTSSTTSVSPTASLLG